MCFGGGRASDRAAEDAAIEARRQFNIEQARLAQEAATAKAETERRAAEEAARQQAQLDQQKAEAEALRKLLQDQEAFRLSELQKVEVARKAERDAELARQEKLRFDDAARQKADRDAAEAAARQKAEALSAYNAERQGVVDKARAGIDNAFAPYNEQYFNQYAADYVSALKPQIDQQYTDAQRQQTFTLANRGNLKSSAAARKFGRLDQTRADAEAGVAQQAQSASNDLRQNVDKQRASALDAVFGAVNAAPVVTADNVGDANTSLRYLTDAINAPVNLATAAAGSISKPQIGQLGAIFTMPAQQTAPRTSYGSGGSAGASVFSRGSGRLVA